MIGIHDEAHLHHLRLSIFKRGIVLWASIFMFLSALLLYLYYQLLVSRLSFSRQLFLEDAKQPPELSVFLHPTQHIYRPPETQYHAWNITKGYRSPDGVKKLVYLINGQFPGPLIESRCGDNITVEVSNILDEEDIAIHWHGLRMRGANEMDGVVGLTQSGISPGATFTYKFSIGDSQTGTFWYHSHSELQRADGLYGGLVIHKPAQESLPEMEEYNYTEEQLLLIGGWYHRSSREVQASYLTYQSFGREPVPDSLIVNGKGKYNCSMAVLSRPIDCKTVTVPRLTIHGNRIRLRIINVGAMAGFTISAPENELEAIQVDGGNRISYPSPAESVGILYPGERVDLILSHSEVTRCINSFMITLDSENFTLQNKALTSTHKFPLLSSHESRGLSTPICSSPGVIYSNLTRLDLSNADGDLIPLSAKRVQADHTILVYTRIEMLSHFGYIPMGYINRTSWAPQSPPLLSLPRSKWNANQLMPWVPGNGEWVDIVINNLDEKGYPFHLHGFDFYVLTRHAFPKWGYHTYNPFSPSSISDPSIYPEPNLLNPRCKDTIHVPRRGYVILRVRADNPGIWFLHCHILWHQDTGMAMGIVVGGDPPLESVENNTIS